MISNAVILKGLDNSPASIVITDASGSIVYVNKKTTEITQYSENELIGSNPNIIKSGKQDNDFYKKMWSVILSGNEWTGTFINRKKSGELYYEQAVISPIKNESDEIEYFLAIKEDITDRIRVEDTLKEDVNKYQNLFENQLEGYALHEIILDENNIPINYRYLEVNNSFLTITGIKSKDDIIGKTLLDLWPDADKEFILKYGKVASDRQSIKFETSILGKNFLVNAYSPKQGYFCTIMWDITELKKVEENLKMLNTNKDKLFSIISHDLRGPFQSILSGVNILKEDYDELSDDDRKNIIDGLYSSSKSAYELLDNLLYWSRLQLNIIKYNPVPINLYEFINDIVKSNYHSAKAKNIELINDMDYDIVVEVDENMLYSIFHNLISNSLKFTKSGGKITLFSNKTNNSSVIVGVSDTGIGMTEENINRILNTNDYFSIKGVNKEVGSGLGLALVKEFLSYHNTKLSIKSQVDVGSEFSFELTLF
jgi:PAS domain S-box-containing protein